MLVLVLVLVLLLLLVEEVTVDMINGTIIGSSSSSILIMITMVVVVVVDRSNDSITVDIAISSGSRGSGGGGSGSGSRTTNTMKWVHNLVRKSDDSVRLLLMSAHLIAHEPSHAAVLAVLAKASSTITNQIRERNAHFPERLISEELVAQVDVQVEVIAVLAADRVEIEPHLVVPLGILVSLRIRFGSLLLLVQRMVVLVAGSVAGEGYNCEDFEFLEEIECLQTLAAHQFEFQRSS